MSMNFFHFSSVSFVSVLYFSAYRSLTSFVKFSRFFYSFFDAILNWIFFLLICLPDGYSCIDFYLLILYSATSIYQQCECDYSNSFSVESLVFSICNIMPSANACLSKASIVCFSQRNIGSKVISLE